MGERKDLDISLMKNKLLARKEELLSIIAEEEQENTYSEEIEDTSMGRLSRMDSIQRHELDCEVEGRRREEIQRIEKALAKVESGDYGYCTECDEEINIKRMQLDPSVTKCIKCASGS